MGLLITDTAYAGARTQNPLFTLSFCATVSHLHNLPARAREHHLLEPLDLLLLAEGVLGHALFLAVTVGGVVFALDGRGGDQNHGVLVRLLLFVPA